MSKSKNESEDVTSGPSVVTVGIYVKFRLLESLVLVVCRLGSTRELLQAHVHPLQARPGEKTFMSFRLHKYLNDMPRTENNMIKYLRNTG